MTGRWFWLWHRLNRSVHRERDNAERELSDAQARGTSMDAAVERLQRALRENNFAAHLAQQVAKGHR
jgi:hypothetical protein